MATTNKITMRGSILFVIFVIVLSLVNFFWVNKKYNSNSEVSVISGFQPKFVEIAGKKIKVEIADTTEERNLGLSGRAPLDEDDGMLFVFEEEGEHLFWMKDMNFAIDIIWIDSLGQVVYVKDSATPESYPEIFNPKVDAKYVLEVNAGFSEKNNLKTGDSVKFEY